MIRLKSLLIKEIIQIRRDPRLFGILVAVPIFQIIVFGFAAVTDIKEIDILVRDRDRSHQSREYIRALEASDYFQVTYLSGPDTEEEEALVSGSAGMVLVIPEDFEEMLARGRPVDVQVLVDGSDSNFASLGAGYMMKATKLFSERLVRPVVQAMAADLDCKVADLLRDSQKRENIEIVRYISDTVGMPTLQDILAELARPGRDPREQFSVFSFDANVNEITDLEEGMRLPGIVTNVTDFGAFIDIGVHQDGLAHISQLADRFVRHPSDVLKVQQQVMATVIAVDLERKRISLSLKESAG